MTTVSVCMAVKNGESTIKQAVESVIWQTLPDWELIVVDDGSDDGTRQAVESFADDRIILKCNTVNLGPAASRNKAITFARGEYIAVMDADDVSFPERFAKQVGFLESRMDVDLVGGQALMFRDNWRAIGIMNVPLEHDDIGGHPFDSIPLHNPCLMGRKEWFKKYGYDESFKQAEDFEMLLRALRYSRYANLPDIILGYRYETDSLSKRIRTRNYVRLAIEHHCFNNWFKCWNAKNRQLVKGLADILIYRFGLVGLLESKTLKVPSEKIIAEWAKLTMSLN